MKQISLHHGPDGVTVHTVVPGPMDTPRLRQIAASVAAARGCEVEQVWSEYLARVLLGRLPRPDEVVWALGRCWLPRPPSCTARCSTSTRAVCARRTDPVCATGVDPAPDMVSRAQDRLSALADMVRVARPGRQVAVANWAEAEHNDLAAVARVTEVPPRPIDPLRQPAGLASAVLAPSRPFRTPGGYCLTNAFRYVVGRKQP